MVLRSDGRRHLFEFEIKRLLDCCSQTNKPTRNRCLILLAYRHGLRRSEVVSLRWSCLDLVSKRLYVKRLKGSRPANHEIPDDELELLMQLDSRLDSKYLFPGRNPNTHLEASGFLKLLKKLGELADFDMVPHPHMLKHTTGYLVGEKLQDVAAVQEYLGHVNIQNTRTYYPIPDRRFEGLWSG